jgi:phosphoenolpyruvate synthase/pyruvate phosphate dikinase
LPFQREDFAGLFRVMDGQPVIIRLIDPPLHLLAFYNVILENKFI